MNERRYCISFAVCVNAMYSASADDVAMVGCSFVCHETGPEAKKRTYPVRDRHFTGSVA